MGYSCQRGRQPSFLHGTVVHEEFAVGGQGNDDGHVLPIADLFRFGKVHGNLSRADERRGRQDDHEQH